MVRKLVAWAGLLPAALWAGTAGDIARAVRENTFDREECYRVRDVSYVREDIKIYFTDGYLIFSKPVAGRRTAAIFTTDVEGGDGEVILLPPDRAERRSLAAFTGSPNLDEHFRAAVLLFTGDFYEKIVAQFPSNPANRKAPEMAAVLDEQWGPVLRNLGSSYQVRLTRDLLLDGGASPDRLFAAMINGTKHGNFDLLFDPENPEQILAGQLATRNNQLYFDTWNSFSSRFARANPKPVLREPALSDYRIEATVEPDLTLSVVTRVKARVNSPSLAAAPFEIATEMSVKEVKVDGVPAEVLQIESPRINLARGGNDLILIVPAEPLHSGRDYEFEFHHSGKVIHEAGDRVYFVSSRGSWYPSNGHRFATFDLTFHFTRELDLVSVGDVIEDHTDGEIRTIRRRTSAPVRLAGFNLGDYVHAKVERTGYEVDVCANRRLDVALKAQSTPQRVGPPPSALPRRTPDISDVAVPAPPPPDPLENLQKLAGEVTSAMEFMASRFGPPALPHLTVSPIPGTFGQGFPGLIYLSTMAYVRKVPTDRAAHSTNTADIFFEDILQAHETAHQWWGNRVSAADYRDNWLMEALANYSALMYLEKRRGTRSMETMLDFYRNTLLARNEAGQTVDSAGPIVLGTRLESSQEPRAWRTITYSKGTWIMQMLRARMGDRSFFDMLAELAKRYDRRDLSTEEFRLFAAAYLPPKTDDPKLEAFFDQWIYGTGIPTLKLTWNVRGTGAKMKLVGTVTQSGVDADFTAVVPVEVTTGRGKTVTQWVRTAEVPVTFTVPLTAAPAKVSLDPHFAVLRK